MRDAVKWNIANAVRGGIVAYRKDAACYEVALYWESATGRATSPTKLLQQCKKSLGLKDVDMTQVPDQAETIVDGDGLFALYTFPRVRVGAR